MELSKLPDKRIINLDLLRVIAIIGVISIHSCAILLKPWGIYDIQSWVYAPNIVDAFSRFSVPLFVMVSGALILKPHQHFSFLLISKRVIRVLIPLLIWEVITKWYFDKTWIGWKDVFVEPPKYHFWFIYMIIGVYLLIPIYQAIFDYLQNKPVLQIYSLILWVIFASIPTVYNPPMLGLIGQNGFLQYGGYFLLGALLFQYQWKPNLIACLLLFSVCSAIIALQVGYLSLQANVLVSTPYSYFNPLVLLSAIGLFIGMMHITINQKWFKLLTLLSSLSFLIYFVHVIFIELIGFSKITLQLSHETSSTVIVFLIIVGTLILSTFTAYLLRLIPRSKMLLG